MELLTINDFNSRVDLTTRRHKGRKKKVRLIVIHTMEAQERLQTAENVAKYFKTVDASSHGCFDSDSHVRVVENEDTAWTAPGVNSESINYELAGFAKQTAEDWADTYSINMLEIVAFVAARDALEFDIPIRKLTLDQLRNGSKGFVAHDDVSKVYKQSTHWDPGPNFPWNYFLGRVRAYQAAVKGEEANDVPPKKTSAYNNYGFSTAYIKARQAQLKKLGYAIDVDGFHGPASHKTVRTFQKENELVSDGVPGPKTKAKMDSLIAEQSKKPQAKPKMNVTALQRAVRTKDDNDWGPASQKNLDAIRAASALGGRKFPHGVEFTQKVVGTNPDGSWGPASKQAHVRTVVQVQKALRLLGLYAGVIEGNWGPATEKAYKRFKELV